MSALVSILVPVASVAAAIVSGIVFIFSNTVMSALARRGAQEGAAAMVAINEVILNPTFVALFVGTGVVCLLAAAGAVITGHEARVLIVLGAATYLLGMLLVTGVVNVPLNDRLAEIPLGTEAAAAFWNHYLDRWSWWNTFRTVAGIVSALLFAFARSGG